MNLMELSSMLALGVGLVGGALTGSKFGMSGAAVGAITGLGWGACSILCSALMGAGFARLGGLDKKPTGDKSTIRENICCLLVLGSMVLPVCFSLAFVQPFVTYSVSFLLL